MIDLHCHILPGVDDGALDVRDSAGLARQAAADGIEAICATPHIRHDHDVRIGELADRVESLNRHLRGEGIPVAVLTGGEVAETAVEGLGEEELARVVLGDGRWCCSSRRPGVASWLEYVQPTRHTATAGAARPVGRGPRPPRGRRCRGRGGGSWRRPQRGGPG